MAAISDTLIQDLFRDIRTWMVVSTADGYARLGYVKIKIQLPNVISKYGECVRNCDSLSSQ